MSFIDEERSGAETDRPRAILAVGSAGAGFESSAPGESSAASEPSAAGEPSRAHRGPTTDVATDRRVLR